MEQGDGTYLDFSGVGKLIKPVYPDRPLDSGTNVLEVEKFDPKTEKWSILPTSANYDLPLYPRMHLLPNGQAFFNGAGQSFNPFGQSYGAANWEFLATLDPKTAQWSKLGLANTATPLAPGFRGSTSSTFLPLKPDANGQYTKASFLTAGGVFGLPSPGSYLATDQSSITTLDTSGNGGTKNIESVALVRNSAITHIVDADQRTVMLKIVGRDNDSITVSSPPDGNVAPPGPYMLFANGKVGDQLVRRWPSSCPSRRMARRSTSRPPRRPVALMGHRVASRG